MNVQELLTSICDYDEYVGGIEEALVSLPSEIRKRKVTSVVNDHRCVNSESVFVAMRGTHVDSHSFIADARNAHAALTIGEKDSQLPSLPDVEVKSTRAVIGPLASALHSKPSKELSLVGITGTNGKTTVSYLYSSIIQAHKKHCFVMGTTGILVDGEKEADSQTTPDPIVIHKCFADYRDKGITTGALEVSSHALDQYRVLGIRFGAVAFTNFSQDHLDYHVSMDQYFDSKSRLFSTIYSPVAVVNIDDERGGDIVDIARKSGQDVVTVSCKNDGADVFVVAESMNLEGSQLSVHTRRESEECDYVVSTPLIGDFNHENIAVALGLAFATHCDMSIATDALSHPETVPGRLQRPDHKTGSAVFVDYAHTPDALKRVLTTIKPLAKKVIVVFGCGGDRDHAKRPLMGAIASDLADVVIVTTDNPRSEEPIEIIEDIVAGAHKKVLTEIDRRVAIKLAFSLMDKGDAVIIAGKGHERGQVFADHTEEFSDIDVVNEIISLESS